MCTMSWIRSSDRESVSIWFNRDESRLRAEAELPSIHGDSSPSTLWISAIDPGGGGTWLGVNQWGIACALLNYYQGKAAESPSGEFTSRGLLATEACARISRLDEVDGWLLEQVASHPFRPFLFVVVGMEGEAMWRYDSGTLDTVPCRIPVTTSSFATDEVVRARRRFFVSSGGGEKFHRWFDPDRPAHSARMEREDAMTVSLSEIGIGPARVSYRYATRPDWEWKEPVVLERKNGMG